jgi:hypothetical protein
MGFRSVFSGKNCYNTYLNSGMAPESAALPALSQFQNFESCLIVLQS